jgi:prevent-host-death family protein
MEALDIRPLSDLRNKYPEIEKATKSGKPVYLTKNGYGSMVVMSLESYAALTNNIEALLDEADYSSNITPDRHSHEEVFSRLKNRL